MEAGMYLIIKRKFRGILVLEKIVPARKMCPGGHIFLGNSVLLDRIYTVRLGPGTNCPRMFLNSFPHEGAS